jgi:hypothetical protein
MNINQIKKVMPFLLKHNICPFFWGPQGVGKTQTMKQYCKENDLRCVALNLATQEVGDLVGLLVHNADGTVKHAAPEWFPTSGNGIIFLDEFNRAQPDVHQAMFPFIQTGTMHTHQLPPGWRVICAGNYQSDKFTVTDISDSALMSRFCHIDFTPTVEEWLMFIENKGMLELSSFIREQPLLLENRSKESDKLDTSFIKPDRRAWADKIGPLVLDEEFPAELRYETYSGIVGPTAAASFITWQAKKEKSLSLADILSNYEIKAKAKILSISRAKKESRFDLLNQPIEELFSKIENNSGFLSAANFIDNLKEFLLDLPRELSTKVFFRFGQMDNFYGKNQLLNNAEYAQKFT